MYWSAGLSPDLNGSRFLTFEVILFTFAVTCAQLFRLFACVLPNISTAFPIAGVCIILMVLFSGLHIHITALLICISLFYLHYIEICILRNVTDPHVLILEVQHLTYFPYHAFLLMYTVYVKSTQSSPVQSLIKLKVL